MSNLASIQDINRIVAQINQGNYDIRPQQFYDRMLLDTLKLGEENYVHTKYTESYSLPKGTQKLQKRRWGGLTAHTAPLLEGIPPAPDKTSMEEITFTATQFGRYMEFTDRVDLDQIDPQIAHYTKELGDVMARTFEKYARETLLSAASAMFANDRTNEGELVTGDLITISDLRFAALRFDRLLVKPLSGNYFVYITSPEALYDLINDPLVVNYMKINNTTRELYENGLPFPLFRITFVPTMLDESYGDLGNPGEYFDGASSEYKMRAYAIDKGIIYHGTFDQEEGKNRVTNTGVHYLSDGSAIPVGYFHKWELNDAATVYPAKVDTVDADGTLTRDVTITADMKALTWLQLPIHRGILMGKEGLARIAIEGAGGVETIIKGLGSAGTNDPLNQRQTIGVKAKSIGFGIIRDEAILVTYSVPTVAISTVGLTNEVVKMSKTVAGTTDVATDNLTPYNVKSDEDQAEKRVVVKKPKQEPVKEV